MMLVSVSCRTCKRWANALPQRAPYSDDTDFSWRFAKTLDSQNRSLGSYKEWYPNGQLKKACEYDEEGSLAGGWTEFWENGQKKLDAESVKGEPQFRNYWNENGEQLMCDGTGLYVSEFTFGPPLGGKSVYETEYRNYKRHGVSKTYSDGRLSLEQYFVEGKRHGPTRDFYKTGPVKSEVIYEDDVEVSRQEFNLFQNPIVVASIECEPANRDKDGKDIEQVDIPPRVLNADEVAGAVKVH